MAKNKKSSKVPLGIVVLAGLNALMGLAMLALGGVVGLFSGLAVGLGTVSIVMISVGLLSLIVAWGLWTGQTWAWYLAILVRGVGLVTDIMSGSIFGFLIDGVIVAYLLRKDIQKYFNVNIGWAW